VFCEVTLPFKCSRTGLVKMQHSRTVFAALGNLTLSVKNLTNIITSTEHTIATLLAEKNVYKLQYINNKRACSRPISLCVLSSFVRSTTLSLNHTFSVTSVLATNNIQVNSIPPSNICKHKCSPQVSP